MPTIRRAPRTPRELTNAARSRGALLEPLENRIVLSVDAVAITILGEEGPLQTSVAEVTVQTTGRAEGPEYLASTSGFQLEAQVGAQANIAPDGTLTFTDDEGGDPGFQTGANFLKDAGTGLGWSLGLDDEVGAATFVAERPTSASINDLQGSWRVVVYEWNPFADELGYTHVGALTVVGNQADLNASSSDANRSNIVSSVTLSAADAQGKFVGGDLWGYLNADKSVFVGVDGNTSDGSSFVFIATRAVTVANPAPTVADVAGDYRALFAVNPDFIDPEDVSALDAIEITLAPDGRLAFGELIDDFIIDLGNPTGSWTLSPNGVVEMTISILGESFTISNYVSSAADTLLPYFFEANTTIGDFASTLFGVMSRLDNPGALVPADNQPIDPDAPIIPSTPPGTLAAVYAEIDAGGDAVAYTQNAQGAWSVANLEDAANIDDLSSVEAVDSILDARGGRAFVAATVNEQVWAFQTDATGVWIATNLSAIPGGMDAGDRVTAFLVTRPGAAQSDITIASLDDNADLVIYTLVNNAWTARNLGQELRDAGQTMPQLTGELTSYVTSWGALNIVGLDSEGDIHTIWTAPAFNGGYRTDNLSAITNAPRYTGGLSVYLTSWNGINIVGTVESGDLIATWWVPSFGGDWSLANFNELFGFTQLQTDSVGSFTTPWGGLNIVGLDANGDLTVFWWVSSFAGTDQDFWRQTNLDTFIESQPGVSSADDVDLEGALVSSFSPVSRQITIAGDDTSGGAGRFVFDLDTRLWSTQNLTRVATNPYV